MPLDGQCPECGGFLTPNARKCDCGWASKPPRTGASTVELDRHRCEWEANGQRCRNPGTSSPNTLGGGPWYCSPHFRCGSGALGEAIVQESQSVYFRDYTARTMYEASLAAYLARPIEGMDLCASRTAPASADDIGKPHADPKAWARQIVAAAANGTYHLPLGIQFARQALRLPREREPGEEG